MQRYSESLMFRGIASTANSAVDFQIRFEVKFLVLKILLNRLQLQSPSIESLYSPRHLLLLRRIDQSPVIASSVFQRVVEFADNSPPWISIKLIIRPCQIQPIIYISGRIPFRRNTLLFTNLQVIIGNTLLLSQLIRGLNHGSRESRLDVPFYVAMEEEDAWIVGSEANHDVAVAGYFDGVPAHGDLRGFDDCWVVGCGAVREFDYLEGVAV